MGRGRAFFEGAAIVGIALLGFRASGAANTRWVPERSANQASSGGPQENVKVHGDWTIEVRNADGTLATRREFRNRLLDSGKLALANFVTRQNTVGQWVVNITGGVNNPNAIVCNTGCQISESTSTLGASHNLTVAQSPSGVVLSGSILPSKGGEINRVIADVIQCPPTATPNAPCFITAGGSAVYANFTFALLNLPITVADGQIVTVTVVFSFS
jgi:hypothetical protein